MCNPKLRTDVEVIAWYTCSEILHALFIVAQRKFLLQPPQGIPARQLCEGCEFADVEKADSRRTCEIFERRLVEFVSKDGDVRTTGRADISRRRVAQQKRHLLSQSDLVGISLLSLKAVMDRTQSQKTTRRKVSRKFSDMKPTRRDLWLEERSGTEAKVRNALACSSHGRPW